MKLTLSNCMAMQKKAAKLIPGMTQLLSKRPDMFSYGIWPGYFSRANGAMVWDLDENRYLDMSISGIGANILGYADPDVNAAVIKAVENGNSCSLNCPEEVELAELLCTLHPWAEKVRFTRTGGESMAVAVRIARAHTGRDKIAFSGYHGWHDWYLAANLGTEDVLGNHLLSGLNPAGVPKGLAGTAIPFTFNELGELENIVRQHGKDLAAIVLEPIRNYDPKPDFIEGVRALSDETGAVFIVDEISAGFRYTTGGAHLVFFPQMPDIAVFSKAMGNGYPIAAVIGRDRIMQSAQKTFISSTYWTERIGPVAALATIKKHKELNTAEHLNTLGRRVQKIWKDAAGIFGLSINVGGMVPATHFHFEGDDKQLMKAFFIQLMLESNILSSTLFYAMQAHTFDHVEVYRKAVEQAFERLAFAVENQSLEKELLGEPSSVGFKRIN